MKTSDIIASSGVIILLAAFLLNLYKKLPANSMVYAFMNFFGAAVCCFASYMVKFYPFVILEGTWGLFGFISLMNLVFFIKLKSKE